MCACEMQGKSKGKGEKLLIAHAAESVRGRERFNDMAAACHKKKDVHSSHAVMRKNSPEDTNMDKMNIS